MGPPTLIVVSGPAGAGKTTLAHALALTVGCPAVCRDEIKEGMVLAVDGFEAAPGDALTRQASAVFFEILRTLLSTGTTLVAEAAFQDHVWRPYLEQLDELAGIRAIRCRVDPGIGFRRVANRPRRPAHADASVVRDPTYYERFAPLSMAVPTIDVDTSDGYIPAIDKIAAFATE